MRNSYQILLAILLVVAVPASVFAQDNAEGYVAFGLFDASTDGTTDVVGEYLPDESLGTIKVGAKAEGENGALAVGFKTFGPDDYDFYLDFDAAGRSVRSQTAITGLIHRLGRESIDHFAAASNHGRLVRHTNLDPVGEYQIDYSLLQHRTEFQPKGSSNLTFAVGYRQQERRGTAQSSTISHCGSCHVISQGRRINETQEDLLFEASTAWDSGQVTFSATTRELENDPNAISLLFDDALHPEKIAPLFDNRLQYDSAEGPQPVDRRSDTSKDIFRLDGTFSTANGFIFGAEGVSATTTNDFTGRESDFSGFLVTAGKNFGNNWNFRWRGRRYSIDNDDYSVNVNHRLGVAGPQAGRTYEDIYGIELDYVSQSNLNRDVLESKVDFTKRFGRKKGNLRLFWQYEDVDRDYYEVMGTTTNIIGASWWARPKKGWKTNVLVQHGEIDDPPVNLNGQYSTLVSPGPFTSPFVPDAAQYYEFHAARIADVGATPSSWDEIKLRGSYTKGSTMLSGSYRYWDGENTDGDLADWAKSLNALNLTIWSAPSKTFEWHAAYTMSETEIDSPAAIPLFDG